MPWHNCLDTDNPLRRTSRHEDCCPRCRWAGTFVQFLAKFGTDVTAISSSHNKEEERQLGASDFIATRGTDELGHCCNAV